MKSLFSILALTLATAAAHAGGGSFPTCYPQSVLPCQTTDGKTLVTITQVFCESDEYGNYVEGNGLSINSPDGLLDGRNLKFAEDVPAWKLSSKETGATYSLGQSKYKIELYIDKTKRGPISIINAKTGKVVVSGEVVCR